MEFIRAEEFLKQPIEVQKVFIEWWQPSIGDLLVVKSPFVPNEYMMDCILEVKQNVITTILDFEYDDKQILIPLLVEGQLRQFIEDKTKHKISISPSLEGKYYVGYDKYANNEDGDLKRLVYVDNVLDGLWKVALQIAKEKVQHEV